MIQHSTMSIQLKNMILKNVQSRTVLIFNLLNYLKNKCGTNISCVQYLSEGYKLI